MKKHIWPAKLVKLAGAGLILAGCNAVNEPETVVDNAALVNESFDVTALDSQTSLLKSAGVNTDSANAFFILRWSEGLGHAQSGDIVRGHASAVAYKDPTTLHDRNALGLDMGDVSVLSGAQEFKLPKIVGTLFGVRYGIFGGRKGPQGGPGGPRGGHVGPNGGRGGQGGGYCSRDSLLAVVNVPFVAGGAYQFKVSGSDLVAATSFDIQAPAQSVQITGLADRDTITATQDLIVTWEGDPSANNMVLVLAPAFKPGRFRGQPVEPIFQRVDAAAGSYTISAQTLQNVLSSANANAITIHLSQAVVRENTDANLGKVLVGAGTDDKVLLLVK